MKQIFTTIALLAMAFSFASCEFDVTCDCNCSCGSTDNNGQNSSRPGNSDSNNGGNEENGGNNGGTNNDNTGNDEYETYNNTFTKGYAGYCGQYYEGQPANTTNWYLELADNNYDLESYEGTGYNIVIDLFASGTSSTAIPAGRYSVEQFDKSEYSAGSLLYGYIAEDETYGEYPGGTWLYEGNDGIAAATAGWVNVEVSGSTYTITYELVDDEYMVEFKGSFTGSLTIYDATEEASAAQATKSSRPAKHFKVRR